MNSSIRCWVWYGTDDLRFEERAMPPLGPTDVLVEVAGCGVSATDLHSLDGSIALYQPPKVLGHEVGGVVRSVGADADYQLVPGSVVYKLPPRLEPELGALAEPLSCAMHAVDRAGLRPADSVAIVGAGAVELLGVLDLRPLITERFALSQAPAAIEAARQRQGVRVLIGNF